MKHDDESPDAFRSSVPDVFLKQIERENSIAAFRLFGARKIKNLIARTSVGLTKQATNADKPLPFTVKRAQVLLEFQIEIANMVAKKFAEQQASHLAHINTLTLRLQQAEAAVGDLRDGIARAEVE